MGALWPDDVKMIVDYVHTCLLYAYSFIKWNFSKFLVDKNGQPVKRYAPNTEPFVSTLRFL